jgi:hypothetical protein
MRHRKYIFHDDSPSSSSTELEIELTTGNASGTPENEGDPCFSPFLIFSSLIIFGIFFHHITASELDRRRNKRESELFFITNPNS